MIIEPLTRIANNVNPIKPARSDIAASGENSKKNDTAKEIAAIAIIG
tara:strand:+ start:400 stop:540 length:141 start_codon:yes stop_codon:yes gene_type:complete